MLLRAELPCREGRLSLRLGTKFSLRYIEKRTGNRKQVHITPSPDENHYFALFDEDDVDFELIIDNTTSVDRDTGFDLRIHGNNYEFLQERHSKGMLKAVETNGRKFHFVKQSSEEGQALVSTAAFQHGISYERASVMVSQMKFSVKYSRPNISEGMAIHVRTLTERVLTIGVNTYDTIERVKFKIKGKENVAVDEQRLIYNGKQMENHRTVGHYGISNNDVVHLILRLSGGGWGNRGAGGICSQDCDNHDILRQQIDTNHRVYGSERGVVCFGERSRQQLSQVRFIGDPTILVEPFVIEMRMASRYKLLEFTPSGRRITFAKSNDCHV